MRVFLHSGGGAKLKVLNFRNPDQKRMLVLSEEDKVVKEILENCRGDYQPPCQIACPLQVDARGYVTLTSQGRYAEALRLVRDKLPFPGIMGRICTRPCESLCRRKDVEESIAIASLKRFISDYVKEEEDLNIKEEKKERIAIVGGGPAGLMAAYDLRKIGYQITIFEALSKIGGMLWVGIPEYRLPRDVLDRELGLIKKLGIEIKINTTVGKEITVSDLTRDFAAVFIAIGAHVGTKLGLAGEELDGVYNATSFLQRVNLGQKVSIGKKVAVIGGGNAAIDAARTSIRLGAEEVNILYRRTRTEMPAIGGEIEEAEQEGIRIQYLVNPVEILGDNRGKVAGMKCIRMKLGDPDQSGRRQPFPVLGSDFFLKVGTVIPAVGQVLDSTLFSKGSELGLERDGFLKVDTLTLQTEIKGIFAGGDVVKGNNTVVDALASGRKAAISIDRYIKGETVLHNRDEKGSAETIFLSNMERVPIREKVNMPTLALDQRKGNFREVELGLNEEQALQEAGRCLDCKCDSCVRVCEFLMRHCGSPKELAKMYKGGYFRDKPEIPYSCCLCNLCEEVCPNNLNIGKMCLAARQILVDKQVGPLPQHQQVKRTQEFVLSDAFRFVQADPKTGKCEKVFFPGCSLSGYSSLLVASSYTYLQKRLPNVGIILGCCGSPNHFLGELSSFREILVQIKKDMEKLGASEMIVACPDCYRTLKENLPEIKLKSIYEIMVEIGPPNPIKVEDWVFSLHDSCTARWEKNLQDSVRGLIKKLNYEIEEVEYSRDKARCCGMGGMIPFVDFELAAKITKKRVNEFHFDIITYCAACREAFALEKPSIHILDLIFNPDWKKTRLNYPKTGKKRRETQSRTKAILMNLTANGIKENMLIENGRADGDL